MFLYISGETSGENRFSNLKTGSKVFCFDLLVLLKTKLRSHPNPNAGYEWAGSHPREPVLWP